MRTVNISPPVMKGADCGGSWVPPLPRDVLWAVLRWLPWDEQLRVRRVCRAWCSVVHERVTAAPRRWPTEALPALLRCNLRALDFSAVRSVPLPALPTSLRVLRLPSRHVHLSRLCALPLDALAMSLVKEGDADALCRLHTLTRLEANRVEMSDDSAVRVVCALTQLRHVTLCASVLVPALLMHGPATLTSLVIGYPVDAAVRAALLATPLQLESLTLPCVLLPWTRWTRLAQLTLHNCDDTGVDDNLKAVATLPALRSLHLTWWAEDPAHAHLLRTLTMLEELAIDCECQHQCRTGTGCPTSVPDTTDKPST